MTSAPALDDRMKHIESCKERALEYLYRGEIKHAVTSMISDLNKHPDCGVNPGLVVFAMYCIARRDYEGAMRFIVGFR